MMGATTATRNPLKHSVSLPHSAGSGEMGYREFALTPVSLILTPLDVYMYSTRRNCDSNYILRTRYQLSKQYEYQPQEKRNEFTENNQGGCIYTNLMADYWNPVFRRTTQWLCTLSVYEKIPSRDYPDEDGILHYPSYPSLLALNITSLPHKYNSLNQGRKS
jgi:hypothetical protein